MFLAILLVSAQATGNSKASATTSHPAHGEHEPVSLSEFRKKMRAVIGPFVPEQDPDRAVDGPAVEVEEEKRFPQFTRKKITFLVEADDRLPAYLLVPHDIDAPVPGVLCLHPTSKYGKGMVVGLGDKPNRNYAEELAQRGYVTLAPDYPGFGDYHIDPYEMGYASATAKGIWNHMRCVDLLQSLPEVDGNRIAAIGHSLFAGVFDRRIKVMVTSCGFTRFAKYYGGDLSGWSHKGYMPRIAEVYDKDPAKMPFDFPGLLAALAPRPVFINAPVDDHNFEVSGVRDCVAFAKPVYARLEAEDNLAAVYPECGHDFPPEIRRKAYAFLDRHLGHDTRTNVP